MVKEFKFGWLLGTDVRAVGEVLIVELAMDEVVEYGSFLLLKSALRYDGGTKFIPWEKTGSSCGKIMSKLR